MPVSENLDSSKDKETLIKKTFALLKSGEKEIQLHDHFKKVVLILGDTGNGKSKFTQWITGDGTKLIAKETEEDTGEYIIEDINGTASSTITSETVYPQLLVDTETNVPYYDCPGFNDTRDSSNDIATTYFIKKIVDFAESVKLIFVINYPSVRKGVDRHNFMKLVKHAADFIKNIEKFKNSIALIITKVDNLYVKQDNSFILVESNKVIVAVAKFLNEVRQDLKTKLQEDPSEDRELYEAAVQFISILLIRDRGQYARIGLFRRPDQPGPLSEISLLQDEKENVKRLIHKNLTFSEKEQKDFGYTVSEKCKNDIHYLVEEINGNVWSRLCKVKEEFKEYYCRLVNVIRSTLKSCITKTCFSADIRQAKELSTRLRDGVRPWDELFREVDVYLSSERKSLQEDIDAIASQILKQIESDFYQIAKALINQLDEKAKRLDMREIFEILNLCPDAILKVIEETKHAKSATELLKIIRDITRDIDVNLPKDSALNIVQQEKNLIFLKTISETEINFEPSTWRNQLESVAIHLNESKIWYTFLDDLYSKFSEYEIQNNREKYNVTNIDDWGEANKPQGIVVTKSNFDQFVENIAKYNIAASDNAKHVELTELRLEKLNQILDMTLKHTADIRFEEPSIFIRADYVIVREILTHVERYKKAALKSGVYRVLHIFALKTIFIDEDISLPGLELRIISPKWEILGTRTIHLDGIDGEPHSEDEAEDGIASGRKGKDGKPGMPGKPGGNFFGIGAFFVNAANLTVTVNGGNGGPGQHENARFRIFGSPGKIGGNGGDGGKGGRGGNPGNAFLYDLNKDSRITICANKGRNGVGGRGGRGGSGGKNGQEKTAELRLQPLGIFSGRRMTEWVRQVDEPTETRASAGKNGTDGENSRGLIIPEPSKAVSEPFKIINMYKRYAIENLKIPFKKVSVLQFIGLLNDNDKIESLYSVFGLIDEVLGLEDEYFKLRKQIDFVPFYQSILNRITKYKKRIEISENAKELSKVLKYLQTTVLSRIHFLRDKSQTNLIIDIGNYLDVLKKDIEVTKNLQTVFNKISLRSRFKTDFKNLIEKRIDEAKYFITKLILPEFDNISEQINDKIHLLIEETSRLQEKTKNQTQTMITKREELERTLAIRHAFSALKFVAKGIQFLGPVGEVVSSVIETVTSVGESLVPDNKDIHLGQISSAMPDLDAIENELKAFKKQTLRCFNKVAEEVLKETEEHPDLLHDIRKKIENIQNPNNDEGVGFQEVKALEDELKQELKKEEEMLECQPDNQTSLQVIRKLKNLIQFNSIMLFFQSESDRAKIEKISNAVQLAEDKLHCLKLYEERIYSSITPMLNVVENSLYNIGSKLDSKSLVTLDITKWHVQRTLKNVQLHIQALTRGFKAESAIVRCVDMLQEVMNILISIYDRIQHYQEQQTLADYIADISSDAVCNMISATVKRQRPCTDWTLQ
ncbi:hypothetical protein HNY73_007130 [Argiope bruennichi]|uniref:Uncharacterized protein n=1 Tax=Argiope bruennichi TaxID=94029 RepID=A0A8T0FDG6_ARGBR|nr:hypothetical protein HNY73_007130 [Argiope bruennichi]